jgi:putative ABC transport system permease protein
MKKVAIKGLAWRHTRSILTAFAIVLGVAMVSGTYILTDTIKKAFDDIFSGSYKHTSAIISGRQIVKDSASGDATVPETLVVRVRRLPGVASAAGSIQDEARLIGRDGKAFATGGAPSVLPARRASRLNVLQALQYE